MTSLVLGMVWIALVTSCLLGAKSSGDRPSPD